MPTMQESNELGLLPSLKWVRSRLRNNLSFRVRVKATSAYVIGSCARRTATANSDLDIAVVIPPKRRISSLRFTERYHTRMALTGGISAMFQGRRVDFQFFFPRDAELASYPKTELK